MPGKTQRLRAGRREGPKRYITMQDTQNNVINKSHGNVRDVKLAVFSIFV